MFIKVESGKILNTAHCSLFDIKEIDNEACIIASGALISDSIIVLTCDDKDEAKKALKNLAIHIKKGAHIWDVDEYKNLSGEYVPIFGSANRLPDSLK